MCAFLTDETELLNGPENGDPEGDHPHSEGKREVRGNRVPAKVHQVRDNRLVEWGGIQGNPFEGSITFSPGEEFLKSQHFNSSAKKLERYDDLHGLDDGVDNAGDVESGLVVLEEGHALEEFDRLRALGGQLDDGVEDGVGEEGEHADGQDTKSDVGGDHHFVHPPADHLGADRPESGEHQGAQADQDSGDELRALKGRQSFTSTLMTFTAIIQQY